MKGQTLIMSRFSPLGAQRRQITYLARRGMQPVGGLVALAGDFQPVGLVPQTYTTQTHPYNPPGGLQIKGRQYPRVPIIVPFSPNPPNPADSPHAVNAEDTPFFGDWLTDITGDITQGVSTANQLDRTISGTTPGANTTAAAPAAPSASSSSTTPLLLLGGAAFLAIILMNRD